MKKIITLLLAFGFVLLSSVGWGQTPFSATYTFGANGNVASFEYNGTAYDGIEMGNFIKVGVTTSGSNGNFRATDWPTGATNASDVFTGEVDLGKYFGFTIDAAEGYQFTVSSITFGVGRSGTGTRQSQWRGSSDTYASMLNNYTTLNAGLSNDGGILTNPDANSSWTGNVLTLGAAYEGLSSEAGFRIYLFNSESTTGTGGLQGPITISGTFELIPSGGPDNPTSFTASSASSSQIDLDATANAAGDNVLVAYNSVNTFGVPTGTYTADDPITGGGTVHYVGVAASLTDHTGLSAGETVYYKAWSVDGSNDYSLGVGANATTMAAEPTNHPTAFSAVANSASTITVSWTDAVPAADGYLIKGSAVSYAAIADPVDGTAEANAALVQNVADGIESHQFSGLDDETPYYFKIFPYNGSGTTVNYKTDGVVEQASATTQAISITTYTWVGADNASWAVESNWNPTRSIPEATDILQFNDGTTKTVTSVPAQTIGRLLVTNNTNVTLQAGATGTLTIAGGVENDLEVASGSQLNISGATALSLSLSAGATGSISGSMTFAGAAHKLLAADAAGITFNSGGSFTAGTGFSGNPFGNTISGSVIFASGSTFVYIAGSNPFAIANAVTVFETGSLYLHQSTNTPSFSGRTYANFEYDFDGSVNVTGTGAVNIDNLKISQGTFNFNVTATPGHSIKGNIEVSNGATLTFTPASAGTINLNGTTLQTISGGGTLSAGANSTIIVSNLAGTRLNNDATLNNLTIATDSFFDIFYDISLTVNGTLTNNAGNGGLVVKSDAAATGSLIHNTAGVPATIERYINGGGYHNVSVPLDGGATAAAFLHSYLRKFDAAAQAWVNITEPTDALAEDEGYMIWYTGANTTYEFAGDLITGAFTASTLSGASGAGVDEEVYNLVPNPYPSAIDWDAGTGWTKTNLQGALYIWNREAGGGANGQYASFVTGTGGTHGATQYIPVGQSFFVEATTDGAPVLAMDNDVRVHNDQAFMKKKEEVVNLLRLQVQSAEGKDEALVHLRENATAAFDGQFDARKLYGSLALPQLYSLSSDNQMLSINALAVNNETTIVPLAVEWSQSGEITLSFSNLEGFENSTTIFLEDLLTEEMMDIREHPAYTFNYTEGDEPVRFRIHFKGVTSVDDLANVNHHIWSHDDRIYITMPESFGNMVRIELFDLLGNRVMDMRRSLDNTTIIRSTAKGVVIVRVTEADRVYTQKLFIR